MRNKVTYYPYYCKKCTRTVYFKEDDIINDICKVCGNKMEKEKPMVAHPKDNLKNIDNKNPRPTTYYSPQNNPSITCPYCHSTNTKKISSVSRMISIGFWGLGSKKIGKQFHCDDCNADF